MSDMPANLEQAAVERKRFAGRYDAASSAYRQISNHNARLALAGQRASALDLKLEQDSLIALEETRRALRQAISSSRGAGA
jgi:hypothetical protein